MKKIQRAIEKSQELLLVARDAYATSDYAAAEHATHQAIALIKAYTLRSDLGALEDAGSLKHQITTVLAHAYNRLNTIALSHSDYPRALEYAEIAIRYADSIGDVERKAGLLTNTAHTHIRRGDYPLALKYVQQSFHLYEAIGDSEGMAVSLESNTSIYQALGDMANALSFSLRALALRQELGSKDGVADAFGNLGIIYSDSGEHERALEYFHAALEINKEQHRKRAIARNLHCIGVVYYDCKEYDSALEYFGQSLLAYEELGVMEGIAMGIENIGSIYANPEFRAYAPDKGEEYLLRSVALYQQLGMKNYERDNHKSLAALYKNTREWEKAYHHIEYQYALQQEVYIAEAQKQVKHFEWERKIAEMEKERQIERIRLESERVSLLKQAEAQAQEVQNTIQALLKKNALLKQIQADIQKIIPHTRKEAYVYITQLSERIERNITPFNSLQEAQTKIGEAQEQFIGSLRAAFPLLSDMEVKVAAFLNMKLSSSAIATALFLSPRTVEYHRRNLRKKMGLGTKEDIYVALAGYAVE